MYQLIWLAVFISSYRVTVSSNLRCEKTLDGVVGPPSDPRDYFAIEISANPTEYTPGEQYTITLRAIGDHKFSEFIMVAEHDSSKTPVGELTRYSVGTFYLRNMLTKFSDKCPNAIANTNVIPKNEIEVDWRAPDAGNGCVAFRLIIMESHDVWYNNGEVLVKRFCEEEKRNADIQPHVLRRCCACDEAKYEVTFEGLWSRNTHPKDFPSDKWRTRFSDVIGASHTIDYSFWNYGEMPSKGLQEVAENASTRVLESELKAKSEHIRTIIKARGISYPNVTGKTFAVFRVDSRHHLMSLVSMIFPSPDWFVGVSNLELCLENCSWIESMTLRLYPNDAGTDEGMTYDSPDQPAHPRGIIRKISSDSPNDERSPFYDPDGVPIKPLAKLYLSRQRLYEKSCNPMYEYPEGEFNKEDCEVTEWSEWSQCSVTCGKGVKYKQRHYKNEGGHYKCRLRLTERASCRGPLRYCREHPNIQEEDDRCQLTEWGEWSSCSVSCGVGTKTRSRRYKNRNAAKRCAAGQENPPILEQNIECNGEGEGCPEGDDETQNNLECPDRPWSTWTPCSATCGKGVKVRYRLSLEEGDQQDLLMRHGRAYINSYDDEANAEREDYYNEKIENEECANLNPVEVVECISDDMYSCDEQTTTEGETSSSSIPSDLESENHLIDEENENEIITEEPWGPYVTNCEVSPWSEWTPCNVTNGICGKGTKEKHREIIKPSMNGGKACPTLFKVKKCRIRCNRGRDGEISAPANNYPEAYPTWRPTGMSNQESGCEMSEWSAWSPCSQSCGPEAVQQRTRKIIRRFVERGEPCSFRIDQRNCQLLACPL